VNGLDSKTTNEAYQKIDEASIKLSGIIGVFDLIVNILDGDTKLNHQKSTMVNFAYYISNELQSLYKTINEIDLKG
jgi:hypothetical protein